MGLLYDKLFASFTCGFGWRFDSGLLLVVVKGFDRFLLGFILVDEFVVVVLVSGGLGGG